jgi:hypothetical protein
MWEWLEHKKLKSFNLMTQERNRISPGAIQSQTKCCFRDKIKHTSTRSKSSEQRWRRQQQQRRTEDRRRSATTRKRNSLKPKDQGRTEDREQKITWTMNYRALCSHGRKAAGPENQDTAPRTDVQLREWQVSTRDEIWSRMKKIKQKKNKSDQATRLASEQEAALWDWGQTSEWPK